MATELSRRATSAAFSAYHFGSPKYDWDAVFRAVLAELRVPTEAMLDAGRESINFDDRCDDDRERSDTLGAWRAMIDTSLAD